MSADHDALDAGYPLLTTHCMLGSTTRMSSRGRPRLWPSVLRWLASVINSWIHFLPLLLVSPFSRSTAYEIYRSWLRISYRIFGITFSLRDDNRDDVVPSPHLYVWLNQSNLAEGPICMLLLPAPVVVINVEYALMPLLGMARALLRDVIIIRQWKSQAKRGIERAVAKLAAGACVMISIEGARSADGHLLPYKKGPVVLAINARATIIPMMLRGGREVLPAGEWRRRPGHVELHLLKAIPTQGLTLDDRNAVLERLRMLAEHEIRERRRVPELIECDRM